MAEQATQQEEIESRYRSLKVDLIPHRTALRRLNYFDGRFLRAEHMDKEQRYVRSLVQLSNVAGGSGVVYGFNLERLPDDPQRPSGVRLRLSRGLAIDSRGQVLHLPNDAEIDLTRLLGLRSRAQGDGPAEATPYEDRGTTPPELDRPRLFQLSLALLEEKDGREEVFGLGYPDACCRPDEKADRLDGVQLWAESIDAQVEGLGSLAGNLQSLRSQVASNLFDREHRRVSAWYPYTPKADENTDALGPLMSKQGPAGPAGAFYGGGAALPTHPRIVPLPIAVVAVLGTQLLFLDPWMARRERIDVPGLSGIGRWIGMRPLSVFFAQLFQFQYQLHESAKSQSAELLNGAVLKQAMQLIELIKGNPELSEKLPANFEREIDRMKKAEESRKLGADLSLEKRGFVELPPAGFVPLRAGDLVWPQLQQLLGDGTQFRIHTVAFDSIPRALLRAQHKARIPLRASHKPRIDMLIPDSQGAPAVSWAQVRWALFCRSHMEEFVLYTEDKPTSEAEQSAFMRYRVHRVPYTKTCCDAVDSADEETLRSFALELGAVTFGPPGADRSKKGQFEEGSMATLVKNWGGGARMKGLMVLPPEEEKNVQVRTAEAVDVHLQLLPKPKDPKNDALAAGGMNHRTRVGLEQNLAELYLLTFYSARIVLLDLVGRRIKVDGLDVIFSFDKDCKAIDKKEQLEAFENLEDQVSQALAKDESEGPEAKVSQVRYVTLSGKIPDRADSSKAIESFNRLVLSKFIPPAKLGAVPFQAEEDEKAYFFDGADRVDLVVFVSFAYDEAG